MIPEFLLICAEEQHGAAHFDATQCGACCISGVMMTLILHFVALNAGVLTAVLLVELVLYRLARSFEPRWHPVVAFGGLISWVRG